MPQGRGVEYDWAEWTGFKKGLRAGLYYGISVAREASECGEGMHENDMGTVFLFPGVLPLVREL
jgi:hypothetical protein